MDSNVISAIISGVCSIVSAFGAIYLKEYLDTRKVRAIEPPRKPAPVAETVSPNERQPKVPPVVFARKKPSFVRPLSIIIGSFIFGVITRTLRPTFSSGTHWESLIALSILIVLVVAFALFHRRRGHQLSFQLENIAIWAGWTSGWSIVHGRIWSDLLGVTIPWWLGCAIVGGFIVSVRRGQNAQQINSADAKSRAAD